MLEARKKLPVYAQMDEFYKMVRQNSTFICIAISTPIPFNLHVEHIDNVNIVQQ